jgi:hypothetical protein
MYKWILYWGVESRQNKVYLVEGFITYARARDGLNRFRRDYPLGYTRAEFSAHRDTCFGNKEGGMWKLK